MNYQLFSAFSTSQINSSKSLITEIIDLNFKQTILTTEEQAEYDNLKYIVQALNLATIQRQPISLKIA